MFIQIINPYLFGGKDALKNQSSYLVKQCLASVPQPDYGFVRIPGQKALQKRRNAMANGVIIEPHVRAVLNKWADCMNINAPKPVQNT